MVLCRSRGALNCRTMSSAPFSLVFGRMGDRDTVGFSVHLFFCLCWNRLQLRLALSPDPLLPSLPNAGVRGVHRHTWSEAATVEGSEGITYFRFLFSKLSQKNFTENQFFGMLFSMLWLSTILFRDSLHNLIQIGLELVILLFQHIQVVVLQARCTTWPGFI